MQRAIGLRSAIAVNAITMIGIGPLVTIPLVLQTLAGPLALVGWIVGAIVALCDGLVWAELSSLFPGSGGTYVYLRNAFGAQRAGRLLAFLFNWQFLLAGPCLVASGYIGFANYAEYLFPALSTSWLAYDGVAAAVGIVTLVLLFAPTRRVAGTGVALACAALATLVIVTVAALAHPDLARAFTLSAPLRFDAGFLAGLGSALFITLYDYAGYSAAALIGDEVRQPNRTIPRAIVTSIVLVAVLYLALQTAILGAIDWHTLFDASNNPRPEAAYIGSTVVEASWGAYAAKFVTVLVLITAFASVFGNLLGFSRIPFAAARDGAFLPVFGQLHRRLHIPHISLVVMGVLSIAACAFSLGQVIAFLTAGIVLIQGVAQIVALMVVRSRDAAGGYRMPLYPLPALIALVGWCVAFYYSGIFAISLGIAWLAAGCIAYAIYAFRARHWPFAAATMACILIGAATANAGASQWSTWDTARVQMRAGMPVFTVDGKPYFVYGAAYFYERIPHDRWRADLLAYRAMGINTIDLYVMWNWHEPQAGVLDFDGRTDPQRDLNALLRTIHELGLHTIVRPGPVIRNEWKNGGYPDWLLTRPEYDMPLHDVLEGRYPATATLQNAHADAAAAQWMNNATHMQAAATWLGAVLADIAPYSHDVLAVALDDDQGAYIDNDTWPAPHWHDYMQYLRTTVQRDAGTRLPLFINTFQMKVTASAPVWAWGNWYQSDAYRIGTHDIAQLSFSTALLGTQNSLPLMASEFQAGWLQGADELHPRPADPANTTLALHRMLQLGVRGVVNFPVQDTVDPPGYEAPWTNIVYAWDAAFGVHRCGDAPCTNARYAPTAAFGALIARHGAAIAAMHPVSDVAIAWMPSAYDEATLNSADIARLADATAATLERCRALRFQCRLIDLRFANELPRERYVIVDDILGRAYVPTVRRYLTALAQHATVTASLARAQAAGLRARMHVQDAALMRDDRSGAALYDEINLGTEAIQTPPHRYTIGRDRYDVPLLRVPAGGACDVYFSRTTREVTCTKATAATQSTAEPIDVTTSDALTLHDGTTTLMVSPGAGARAFALRDANTNAFNSVGAFRDDVAVPPSPSARDYIAAYTHPLEAGTFNRPYTCTHDERSIVCSYTAPDLNGITFSKQYRFSNGALVVRLRASAPAATLIAVNDGARVDTGAAQTTVATKDGYRLIRLTYPANTDTLVTVMLPGATAPPANRP